MPVATTTPVARPYVTMAEVYAILLRSPRGQSSGRISSASFSEGTDSPVKEASCTFKLAESIRRKSAGTISPSPSITTSPTTNSLAGITLSSPWRKTRAVGALILRRASREDCAFFSCTIPMTALTITIIKITAASVHSCKTAEKAAAPMRISTIGSMICAFSICRMVLGGFERSSLRPYFFSLSAASASPNPSSEVCKVS